MEVARTKVVASAAVGVASAMAPATVGAGILPVLVAATTVAALHITVVNAGAEAVHIISICQVVRTVPLPALLAEAATAAVGRNGLWGFVLNKLRLPNSIGGSV